MKNFSVIIPIYNESRILEKQVVRIINAIDRLKFPVRYEILLVENGSTDGTCKIAKALERKYRQVRVVCISNASYGQAYKTGLRKALYQYTFQFDIDFWDVGFITKSQKLLDTYDFVVGSKNMNHSKDNRSIQRKIMSKLLEKMINLRFNVSITDTHGLKAIKKSMAESYLDKVVCPNHFFDSELLIRAISDGLTFIELPVNLKELRASRFSFSLRVREVIREFFVLMSVKLQIASKAGTVPAWGLSWKEVSPSGGLK